jgi:hypothetical protein
MYCFKTPLPINQDYTAVISLQAARGSVAPGPNYVKEIENDAELYKSNMTHYASGALSPKKVRFASLSGFENDNPNHLVLSLICPCALS